MAIYYTGKIIKRQKKNRKRRTKRLTGFAGRPQRIEDSRLRSIRDSLVDLLANTWTEVGWNLQTIESSAEVPRAFKIWESEQQRPHLIFQILLRQPTSPEIVWPSECGALGQKLDAMYRQLGEVGESIRQVAELQQRCRESLGQAEQALNLAISHLPAKNKKQKDEQVRDEQHLIAEERARLIAEECAKRKRTCELAKDTYLWLDQYYKELELTLKDGYAYYARAELVRFRDSHRRRLNPLNIANALAGLPFIGYRQSLKRCSRFKREKTFGLRYETFVTIRRIVKSRPVSIGLRNHVETWLQNRRPSESLAISELQQKWYYLEPSIETAPNANAQPEELAFKITSEYFRRLANRSAADALLETNKRITPVVKLKKVRS